jgi:hypothetical protein
MQVHCPTCGQPHDLDDMEPSFRRPDAYLAVPPAERAVRTLESNDAVVIRNADDTETRYYLRVLMPFQVAGRAEPYSWGVWVEVAEDDFQQAMTLWDDPRQSAAPAFAATLANVLPGYDGAFGLPGLVALQSPKSIPHFRLAGSADHPLVREQRGEVCAERVLEWVTPMIHPEAPQPQRARFSGSDRNPR